MRFLLSQDGLLSSPRFSCEGHKHILLPALTLLAPTLKEAFFYLLLILFVKASGLRRYLLEFSGKTMTIACLFIVFMVSVRLFHSLYLSLAILFCLLESAYFCFIPIAPLMPGFL